MKRQTQEIRRRFHPSFFYDKILFTAIHQYLKRIRVEVFKDYLFLNYVSLRNILFSASLPTAIPHSSACFLTRSF